MKTSRDNDDDDNDDNDDDDNNDDGPVPTFSNNIAVANA